MMLFWQNCIMEQDLADVGNKCLEIFFSGQILLCSVIILVYLLRKRKKAKAPLLDTDFVYNSECPICFNELTLPIKSDCDHGYCIECLHTYWKKRTWKNICPLCRQSLKNLRLVENETCRYPKLTREILLQKVSEMSMTHYRGIRFCDKIFTETAYYFIIGTFLLILWTWAVVNTDKLIYYSLWIYNSFYNTKKEINS
nr:transcriptional regulator of yeast form adherence 3-like [Leptinotarsa decemlineata]